MDDRIIASYMKTDGSRGQFLPHNESKTAHWDSKTGLTLSGEGREQFFPSHRILEVNRFTESESYAWYAIQNDPVIQQFYTGERSRLKQVLLEMSESFDSATFDELKQWIADNTGIDTGAVKGSLVRIALTSGLVEAGEGTEVPASTAEVEA